MLGFFIHGTANRELAEELYQELFMRIIQHAGSYKPKAAFRTWVFTIARNQLRDVYRRNAVRQIIKSATPQEQNSDLPQLEPAADLQNPLRSSESAEIREILFRTLPTLPEEQREMFLLREVAGMDFKESARAASCSVNTAKSRMRYALNRLREAFAESGLLPER